MLLANCGKRQCRIGKRSAPTLQHRPLPMAGPEDSATSSHHHGNPPHASDLYLQDSEDSLKNQKHKAPPSDHSQIYPSVANVSSTTNTASVSGENLRVDLRNGKAVKGTTTAIPIPNKETSQPVCEENEDVFDVNHHPHLFVLENDEDIDSQNEEEPVLGDDTFVDEDCEKKNNADNQQECVSCNATEESDAGKDAGKNPPNLPQGKSRVKDASKSCPRATPLPTASDLMTVCRHSHSHLVVCCQIQNTSADVSMAASCPAAFSPRWTQFLGPVRPVPLQSEDDGQPVGRARLNTITGIGTSLQPSSRRSQGHVHDPLPDDPAHPAFKGRSRCYSNSDVQRLQIKEMSKELRRIGDEFNRLRGGKLITVTKTLTEENNIFEM